MKKILSVLLLYFFSSPIFSQQFINKTVPIKDFKTKEELYKDTISSKFILKLGIDFSNYELMYITDFVNYRDSLLKNKIFFKTLGIKANYKQVETAEYKEYNSNYNLTTNSTNTRKRFMCYRTTEIDDNNNYKLYFSIIE